MGLGIGFLLALCFALGGGITGAIRFSSKAGDWGAGFFGNFGVDMIILFFVDWLGIFFGRPMMTFPVGLIGLVFVNLVIVAVVAVCWDTGLSSLSLASVAGWVLVLITGIVWIAGVNSGHSAYKAAHIVHVTVAGSTTLPASSTAQLVTVDASVATNEASQAMNTDNYSTYLQLGPATLQMVQGKMVYVFPLEYDGSGAKARLHGMEPGYLIVSATIPASPSAPVVRNYNGIYSMRVSLGGGQGSEPLRWAYDHGYSGYLLDDATLEVRDDGAPFYTVTLLRPQLGWTFDAPVGVLLINAHTGQIKEYPVGKAPSFADRVISQNMAATLASWYGFKYFSGGVTNAGRYQVSGDPVLTYTGSEHPTWRVLLTSFNSDVAVSKILEINAATGAMSVYTPTGPMGTEQSATDALNNATGQGASLIRANHDVVSSLALHVIYGHLTWMATYVPEGVSHPSFAGLGFVDAYNTQANNVAFGSNEASALQAYLTQLSSQSSANPGAPGAGAQYQIITGTIAAIRTDVSGGQQQEYLTLAGKPGVAYVGTVTSLGGPAILFAKPGDSVILQVFKVDLGSATETLTSFTDKSVPVGSVTGPSVSASPSAPVSSAASSGTRRTPTVIP
jgi:hypothetical protein